VAPGFTDHCMLPLADLFLCGTPARRHVHRAPAPVTTGRARSMSSDAVSEGLFEQWCAEAGLPRASVASVVQRVERLDFSKAWHRTTLPGGLGGVWPFRARVSRGLSSHGAVSLARVLERALHVAEVRLNGNKIGPYGAAALARALALQRRTLQAQAAVAAAQAAETVRKSGGKPPRLPSSPPLGSHGRGVGVTSLRLRGCFIGERGARALAEHLICPGIDLAREFASRSVSF